MAKNRDINYNDWTKNTARRQGVWVSYRNPNDNTYYAVRDSGLPNGEPDPNDNNRMIYKPMTEIELSGEREDGEPGLAIYNQARDGIKHITKKILKAKYNIVDTANRVNGKPNFGPGLWEAGHQQAKGLTYEWAREQSPKGRYLVCIRMTQEYVDKWVFFGQPPPVPEPTEEEAPEPKDEREHPVDENGRVFSEYETLESERVKQKTASTSTSEIKKSFTLKTMQKDIEMGEQVLKAYAKILRRDGITPEDLNGFDISKQTRLYKKSYTKAKQLLQSNDINFDEQKFTDDDIFDLVLDKEFNLLHFLSNETSNKKANLETETKENNFDESPPNPDITSIYYDGFNRRDLSDTELSGSVAVFLPEDADPETDPNKRASKYNLMLDRSRNRLRGWSNTTLSMLANTDKILEQHKNIDTDDLLPWTEFLSRCVYPNPCIKPTEIKEKEPEPNIVSSIDELPTVTASQVQEHNLAASSEVKESIAAKRGEEFNIIEDPILSCGTDIEDMIQDIEDLYGTVLNKFSISKLLSASAEKAKNEMRNQAAIFADSVEEGIEQEVKKVIDSVVKELECGVDIAKGKIEDKFLSPLKEIPNANELLSHFELPEMTFDLPSFKIKSFLSYIKDVIEETAIEMIESMLISMVTEMVKDYIDCEKLISVDGIKDKGGGLFDPFSKAAFGQVDLSDLVSPESVKNIANSLGIPEGKIDDLNYKISEVVTPEEMLSLLNDEASEAVLRRLTPIIKETLQGVANMTIEILASYLGRVGDNMPQEAKDRIFEAKTEATFCSDLDYEDAAKVLRDILGDRANIEAKAAFNRNKEKLKSLCGLKKDTQDALSEAITEMPIPDKLSAAAKIADDAITKGHRDIIAPYLESFYRGKVIGTRGQEEAQSEANFKVYTNEGEYPAIRFGVSDNAADPYFRLGKWAMRITKVDGGIREYRYSISHRGGIRTPQNYGVTIQQPIHGAVLPQDAGPEYKSNVNKALNGDNDQLFTNKVIKNKEDLRKDILSYYRAGSTSLRRRRIAYRDGINNAINVLYETISSHNGKGPLRDASKIINLKYRNMGALAVVLRCMLPFAISGFRTLNRADGDMTPIWFPKDVITNKLVTEYVYAQMFGSNDDWFFINQSAAAYGDTDGGPLEKTRRGNLLECRVPTKTRILISANNYHTPSEIGSKMRPRLEESMPDLYSAISGVNQQAVNITPGIEDIFDSENVDSENAQNIAAAKKVISLLLNLFLPYKDGDDRSTMTQSEWMSPAIVRFGINTQDYDVRFPLQALVALVVISGFHDNNGWRQSTYYEYADDSTTINFRNFLDPAEKLFEKSFEDDDTELPKL
jgi:hypothetical protein